MNEVTSSTTSWIIRSNVRYAHQFTAGGSATITSVQQQLSSAQKFPSSTKIILYANSVSNTVGTKLGELAYSSINGSDVVTYIGSVAIPSSGTYWLEVAPTAAIANHNYTATVSTSSTGSVSGWSQKKTLIASGTASNANPTSWTSTFSGTPYHYPKFSLIGTSGQDEGPWNGGPTARVDVAITTTYDPRPVLFVRKWIGNKSRLSYKPSNVGNKSQLTYKRSSLK